MKTEKTFAVLFVVACALKIMNVPGASILLLLTLTILSALYFPLAFYFFSDKTLKAQNIPLSIIGGIMLSIIPIGVLFRIMFWPGAMISLTLGFILLPILFLVTYLLYQKSQPHLLVYYKNYLTRIVFWSVLCFVFYFISTRQLLQLEYRDNPELLLLEINAYENPDNTDYREALEKYRRKQDSLPLN